MEKSLQQIKEEKGQVNQQLDKLDRKKRQLNSFQQDIEELYGHSLSSLRHLYFLNLTTSQMTELDEVMAQLNRNSQLIFADIDQKQDQLKKAERQAEDKLDQLSRDYGQALDKQGKD